MEKEVSDAARELAKSFVAQMKDMSVIDRGHIHAAVAKAARAGMGRIPLSPSEAKIQEIADIMRELRWSKKVAKQLADKWKLTSHSITKYACEASRIVRREVTDSDVVVTKVCNALERVLDEAVEMMTWCSDHGKDASKYQRSVIQAAKVWAEITGNAMPQQQRVHITTDSISAEKRAVIDAWARARGSSLLPSAGQGEASAEDFDATEASIVKQ